MKMIRYMSYLKISATLYLPRGELGCETGDYFVYLRLDGSK